METINKISNKFKTFAITFSAQKDSGYLQLSFIENGIAFNIEIPPEDCIEAVVTEKLRKLTLNAIDDKVKLLKAKRDKLNVDVKIVQEEIDKLLDT